MKQQKSRKGIRILKKRTPTGKNVIHYEKAKPAKAKCARCSSPLSGIPQAIPSKLGKMTRSQRTVSRRFGGVLCNKCVRSVEKYKARMEDGYPSKRDLTIEKYLPKGWHDSLSGKDQKDVKKKEKKTKTAEKKVEKKPAKKDAKEKKTTKTKSTSSAASKAKKKTKKTEKAKKVTKKAKAKK